MSTDHEWYPNAGVMPVTDKNTPIIARIRCCDRETAERQGAKAAGWWPRWTVGNSPGDIVEWRKV